jgi:hypothetical protein
MEQCILFDVTKVRLIDTSPNFRVPLTFPKEFGPYHLIGIQLRGTWSPSPDAVIVTFVCLLTNQPQGKCTDRLELAGDHFIIKEMGPS